MIYKRMDQYLIREPPAPRRRQIAMNSGDITKFLEEKKKLVDEIIKTYIPEKMDAAFLDSLLGPATYEYDITAINKTITEPLRDFLDRGGKRWRPGLFLLLTEALHGDTEKVKDFAIIPELAHTGSIIIDDVEDKGEMRRGKPCLHKMYGTDVAINAGNIMYFLPLMVFMRNRDKFSEKTLLRAYKVYTEEMINIHIGQATDIYWHSGKSSNITEKQYLQMCSYKTGCLSRMAARLAVVLSGGSVEQEKKIGSIGEAIGIAFQIRDDTLSIVGEEFASKKGYGDDITEGKRSLLVIHTLKNAHDQERKRLLEILDSHTTDKALIQEAISIIKKYKAVDYATGIAERLVKETWETADPLLPESEAKKTVKAFLDFIVERKI